jgi:hypothetical protein
MTIDKLPLVTLSKNIVEKFYGYFDFLGYYVYLLAKANILTVDQMCWEFQMLPEEFNRLFSYLLKVGLVAKTETGYRLLDPTELND